MLLTVQEFLKRRPDMEVHMENAIQSAINSSFIRRVGEVTTQKVGWSGRPNNGPPQRSLS